MEKSRQFEGVNPTYLQGHYRTYFDTTGTGRVVFSWQKPAEMHKNVQTSALNFQHFLRQYLHTPVLAALILPSSHVPRLPTMKVLALPLHLKDIAKY